MVATLSIDSGSPPLSAIAGLRSATWASHQRLEKRLDVKTRFSGLLPYREHLEKMWGFCAGVELQLVRDVVIDALPDLDRRRKLPLLQRDLIALGAAAEHVMQLPRCETLPCCTDPAAAFGCLYVLEGATLGGRTLLPMVQSRLGLTAEHGAAFLASYGEAVPSMWRSFGAALDAWCSRPERQVLASAAAVATFTSLEHWLCGNPG